MVVKESSLFFQKTKKKYYVIAGKYNTIGIEKKRSSTGGPIIYDN